MYIVFRKIKNCAIDEPAESRHQVMAAFPSFTFESRFDSSLDTEKDFSGIRRPSTEALNTDHYSP